ncbi:hypothetical protein GF357_04635 [Candidatus Dojkabacteria bacterium]|nr:hypothetical protein [Candidatus Dojkabacteria bacterium]
MNNSASTKAKIKLKRLPQNKKHFLELMEFFEDVLGICKTLKITPIVEASLAVFAYTSEPTLKVNDVDMLIPEDTFTTVVGLLKERGFDFEIKEYHVLRVHKGDMKIEFDSIDYWPKQWNISIRNIDSYPILSIGSIAVHILDLESLIKTYESGLENSEQRKDEYKYKVELLKETRKTRV